MCSSELLVDAMCVKIYEDMLNIVRILNIQLIDSVSDNLVL